jgi:cholest-4-en-3-one 26-monooxygenase
MTETAYGAPAPDPAGFFSPAGFAARGYPYEEWARLRREEPVARIEGAELEPFWAVTRHADIARVSRDPGTFASAPGNLIRPRGASGRSQIPLATTLRAALRTGIVLRPTVLRVVMQAALRARRAGSAEGSLKMLLNMDPPQHGAFRRLLSRRFTARGLAPFVPGIRKLAEDCVEDVARRAADPERHEQAFDFVTELAARFPMAVVCELLGVPRSDFARLFRWSNAIVGADDDEYALAASLGDTIEEARLGLFDYFARHVAQRRRHPGEDLVSQLAGATVEGGPLGDFEILCYCFLLLLAGNETTRNATSGGMLAFLERPGLWQRLRGQASRLEGTVEEVVRWSAPIVYFARTATRNVELGGRPVRRGDRVALFYPSANRDEAVFREPDAFDPGRAPNPHLSFGIGEHFCLGANLARLELRLLFGAMLRRLPDLEPAGPASRLRSNFVGGVKHLPVRFAAGAYRPSGGIGSGGR